MKTSAWIAAGLVFASGPATAADLKIVDVKAFLYPTIPEQISARADA